MYKDSNNKVKHTWHTHTHMNKLGDQPATTANEAVSEAWNARRRPLERNDAWRRRNAMLFQSAIRLCIAGRMGEDWSTTLHVSMAASRAVLISGCRGVGMSGVREQALSGKEVRVGLRTGDAIMWCQQVVYVKTVCFASHGRKVGEDCTAFLFLIYN